MASPNMQASYRLSWQEEEKIDFISSWVTRPLGAIAGVYFGASQGFRFAFPNIDQQSYHNSKEMVAKLDHLKSLIAPEALVTLSPQSVSARLDQAGEYVAANSNFFSSQGLRGLEQHISPIKQDVGHFISGWPENAYKWYPYLHGGTTGVDFELGAEGYVSLFGGQIKPARGDEFYLGEGLNSLNKLIADGRKQYSAEVKQVDGAVTDAYLYGGFLGGAAGLALGAVLGFIVVYKGLEKAIKAFHSK